MVINLMKYNPAFLGDEALIASFVARTSELERILEVLRENTSGSNQHLLVIGPRGIGKTTLVLRTAAEIRADPTLGAHWYPIVYGEETYQVSSAGEFWLEALFHVGQQTDDARWQRAYEELLGERSEERLRLRVLAQLMDFADEQGKRLVLMVENLNMLFGGQISDEDAWVLRHTLMNESRIMLIGTATSRFRVMDEYNQALYELFRILELEPLADEEAQAVWTAASGQVAPRHQLRPIQILTGGNPRLIRILSEFAAKTSFRSLMEDLTRLVDEHTEYFKHHLDNLPSQERKVFVVLADLWDPSTARQVAEAARLEVNIASAQLKRLVDRGAVTTPDRKGRTKLYQVAERMYNIYHLMRRRGQPSSRVHAVVRFMISLYRDEELIRTTQSLAEEAARLTADQRREHFVAYEAILAYTREPRLANQLIEATRQAFEAMPDVPSSVLRLIDPTLLLRYDTSKSDHSNVDNWADFDVEKVSDIPTLLRIAAWGIRSKQHSKALEVLDRTVSLDAENARAWLGRASMLHSLGRPGEALESLDRAVALDGDIAIAWATRGFVLDLLGRPEGALESFDRALTLDAENANVWAGRGTVLGRLGRMEEALEAFDRVTSLNANDASAWMRRGIVLDELGRIQDALESFDRTLSLDPENAFAWANRGLQLDQLGRVKEALESYDRAVLLDEKDAYVWRVRGAAQNRLGQVVEALTSFDRAVSLNAADAAAWRERGLTLGHLGRTEEALESFDRAISLEPEDAVAWANRGASLAMLERLEEALASFNRALSLEPEDATTWTNRGTVLFQLGNTEEALASFERALPFDTTDSTTWTNRGSALFLLGNTEEALASFDRALELEPESATAWANHGAALAGLGRIAEALASFDRALSIETGNATTWTNRGGALAKLGNAQEALISFDRALTLDPGSVLAWQNRSFALLDLGRTEEALESFEHAMGLPPGRELVGVENSAGALDVMSWAVFKRGPRAKLGLAERWARRAVEQAPERGSARHTLACILGAHGQWKQALDQAEVFLLDRDLLDSGLDDVIDFFIDAAASGHGDEVVRVVESAGAEDTLEPLIVAIRRLAGEQVDIAREILEISTDVIERIEIRRQELRED